MHHDCGHNIYHACSGVHQLAMCRDPWHRGVDSEPAHAKCPGFTLRRPRQLIKLQHEFTYPRLGQRRSGRDSAAPRWPLTYCGTAALPQPGKHAVSFQRWRPEGTVSTQR